MAINVQNVINAFDTVTTNISNDLQNSIVNSNIATTLDTELVQPMQTELTNFVQPITTSINNVSDEIYYNDPVNGHTGILADAYNKTEEIINDISADIGDIPVHIDEFTKATNDSINSVAKTLGICFVLIGVAFIINAFYMNKLSDTIKTYNIRTQ